MTEPTPQTHLAQSVTSHRQGNLEAAADGRWQALSGMQPADPEYPGALAAAAFTERLLGRRDKRELNRLGDDAYKQAHANLANADAYSKAQLQIIQHELPSVALHSAVLSARFGIRQERLYGLDEAMDHYDRAHERVVEAWEGAKTLPRFERGKTVPYLTHQHQINFARRRSVIEALHPKGSATKAIGYAAMAMTMSPFSESSRFTANTDPDGARFDVKAKAKALAGGALALRVALLDGMPRSSRPRLLAWANDRAVL